MSWQEPGFARRVRALLYNLPSVSLISTLQQGHLLPWEPQGGFRRVKCLRSACLRIAAP